MALPDVEDLQTTPSPARSPGTDRAWEAGRDVGLQPSLLNSKAFEAGCISVSALRDEQLETFERRCAWALERCETIRPQPLPI